MQKILLFLALFLSFTHISTAQWQPTEGINGASVFTSVVVGSNTFIGTSNGAYLSSDNGVSWKGVNNGLVDDYYDNGLTNLRLSSLVVNGSKIYAGTGKGVFVSANNGDNWTFLGIKNFNVYRIGFIGSNLIISAQEGIYLSNNEGITWTSIGDGLPITLGYSFAINGSTIYVASYAGFYTSTNNGATWTLVNNGLSGNFVTDIITKGTKLYMGTSDDVFSSTNNGATWVKSRFNQPVFSLLSNGSTIYAGLKDGAVYTSTDDGANWILKGNGITKSAVNTLAAVGTTVLAGNAQNMYSSTNNGDNWQESSKGLKTITNSAIATNQTTTLAGTEFGLYSSANNGANWTKLSSNLDNVGIFSLDTLGSQIYASAGSPEIYRTVNNGSTWTPVNAGLEPPIVNNSSLNSTFLLATSGTNIFAGNVNGVYLLKPNSSNWTRFSNNFDRHRITNLNISNDKLFASAYFFDPSNGDFSIKYAVFMSTDNGANWTKILSSLNIVGTVISVGNKIFASTYTGGIVVSENNGSTWTAINNGLTNLKTSSLLRQGSLLFTNAYRGGIFYSNDNGANWRAANEGLPTKIIYRIKASGNFLLIGTDMGIFRRPLSEFITTGIKENKDNFNCTIFPNPVSNSLTINASDNLVGKKYSIKNILGEIIKADILTNNSTELNVHNLANGIYFLHLIGTNKTVKFVKE
jgi:hypothetical protein